jgi:hypothetical protein
MRNMRGAGRSTAATLWMRRRELKISSTVLTCELTLVELGAISLFGGRLVPLTVAVGSLVTNLRVAGDWAWLLGLTYCAIFPKNLKRRSLPGFLILRWDKKHPDREDGQPGDRGSDRALQWALAEDRAHRVGAHAPEDVEVLKAVARQRVNGGQDTLNFGSACWCDAADLVDSVPAAVRRIVLWPTAVSDSTPRARPMRCSRRWCSLG